METLDALPPNTCTPLRASSPATQSPRQISRREALTYSVCGLAGLAGGAMLYRQLFSAPSPVSAAELSAGTGDETVLDFSAAPRRKPAAAEGDGEAATQAGVREEPAPAKPAPPEAKIPLDPAFERWRDRGWAKEAYHYEVQEGSKVRCLLCPNGCGLKPGERGKCRNRVNQGGKLYTVAYACPCSLHVDPIEKKPLLHYRPGARALSLATAGCNLRCLNCQNWTISQIEPEKTKDVTGEAVRLDFSREIRLARGELERLSLPPEDVIRLAELTKSETIAYTYSEPIVFYEYMRDTCTLARKQKLANLLISNGSINEKPLLELCDVLDAANINLKCFTDEMYETLNGGHLQPILDTLLTLKKRGVWFEVTNLMVPTYTYDLEVVKKMVDWLVKNIGVDYPLHFSRFHPLYKLTHLPPTPKDVLLKAREIARAAGLRYVYLGNARDIADGETTWCPGCKKAVVERDIFETTAVRLRDGKCRFCGTKIAGVWA